MYEAPGALAPVNLSSERVMMPLLFSTIRLGAPLLLLASSSGGEGVAPREEVCERADGGCCAKHPAEFKVAKIEDPGVSLRTLSLERDQVATVSDRTWWWS